MHSRFGLAGNTALGTLFAYPADDALLELARTVCVEGALAACTKVDGVLVCRALGSQADTVRKHLASIWSLIRPQVAGRPAVPPRIWAT
jgi:urease accessory protein